MRVAWPDLTHPLTRLWRNPGPTCFRGFLEGTTARIRRGRAQAKPWSASADDDCWSRSGGRSHDRGLSRRTGARSHSQLRGSATTGLTGPSVTAATLVGACNNPVMLDVAYARVNAASRCGANEAVSEGDAIAERAIAGLAPVHGVWHRARRFGRGPRPEGARAPYSCAVCTHERAKFRQSAQPRGRREARVSRR